MNELFERRSVRSYNSAPVEDCKLELVLKAGNYAPSAMNNQDRAFTAILNKDILNELNAAVRSAVDQSTVARIEGRLNGVFSFFYNAPALIVVSHDKNGLYPAADCACALENMFIQAKALGLGSCWINQLNSLCDLPAVRAVLTKAGVPENHTVFGSCALGYSDTEGELLRAKQSKITVCR